MVFL
jgi:hypothetical protein